MKKKIIVFAAGLAVCSFLALTRHTTATAETDWVYGPLPTPTNTPEQEALQNKNTPSESVYYISSSNAYSGISLRRIDIPENDAIVAPTPMPEFQTQEAETSPKERVAYYESEDGIIWKFVSVSEWVTPETLSSEAEKTEAAENNYESKILSNKISIWYRLGTSETKIATVESLYNVWYYLNDNKVHLRGRSHTYQLFDSEHSAQIVYGNIINTDGSVSFTSGDKFKLTKNGEDYITNLNFYVSPTTYSFE